MLGFFGLANNLNPLMRNNWRASLVPAATVILAPIAYIKVIAVKNLVVGWSAERRVLAGHCFSQRPCLLFISVGREFGTFTLKNLECSKQASA